jgi:hypothetical protein
MLHLVSIWEEVRNVPNERKDRSAGSELLRERPMWVRIGLDAADGKNLEIFSPSIGTPLLERGLIDEVDLHILPRLLGAGTRLYDVAGGTMRKLQNLGRR